MREKNYSAFTLVELLIVAIIIGLLSSLALATYARYKEHAVRTRIFAAVEEWNRVHSVFLANSLMPPDARLSKKESPREAAMEAYSILRGYIPSIEKYATLEDFELEVAQDIGLEENPYKILYAKKSDRVWQFMAVDRDAPETPNDPEPEKEPEVRPPYEDYIPNLNDPIAQIPDIILPPENGGETPSTPKPDEDEEETGEPEPVHSTNIAIAASPTTITRKYEKGSNVSLASLGGTANITVSGTCELCPSSEYLWSYSIDTAQTKLLNCQLGGSGANRTLTFNLNELPSESFSASVKVNCSLGADHVPRLFSATINYAVTVTENEVIGGAGKDPKLRMPKFSTLASVQVLGYTQQLYYLGEFSYDFPSEVSFTDPEIAYTGTYDSSIVRNIPGASIERHYSHGSYDALAAGSKRVITDCTITLDDTYKSYISKSDYERRFFHRKYKYYNVYGYLDLLQYNSINNYDIEELASESEWYEIKPSFKSPKADIGDIVRIIRGYSVYYTEGVGITKAFLPWLYDYEISKYNSLSGEYIATLTENEYHYPIEYPENTSITENLELTLSITQEENTKNPVTLWYILSDGRAGHIPDTGVGNSVTFKGRDSELPTEIYLKSQILDEPAKATISLTSTFVKKETLSNESPIPTNYTYKVRWGEKTTLKTDVFKVELNTEKN